MKEPSTSAGWLGLGEAVTLDNCEREPIHLPGRVQAHGAVIVVAAADGDRIVQLSENAAALLGLEGPADALLGRALDDVLGIVAAETLRSSPTQGPPFVRPVAIETDAGRRLAAQCFRPADGLLAIDLEPAPELGADGSAISVQAALVASRLAGSEDLGEVAEAATDLLWRLTGFDRVWAYRFEADGHGVVIAERRHDDLGSFLGLHFPESDIPQQARQLYLTSGVRLIGDSGRGDVPLIPEVNPLTGERLDLSASDLRGVSPMHVRYLRNMGVTTSMSVPLVVDGRLWGLLSAHQYGRPQALSMLQRSQCETLGKLTAMQLAATQRLEHARAEATAQRHVQRLVGGLGSASSAAEALAGDPASLLGTCGAQGAIIRLDETVRTVGEVPAADGIDALIDALDLHTSGDVVALEGVATLEPALAPLATTASGALAICLSRRHRHWVVWVRPEQVQEVTWANRDGGLVRRDPDGNLELGEQESFARWAEQVHHRSAPWTAAEIDAARDVKGAIATFALHQAEQLEARAALLARANEELDAFAYSAAHDLRQPVRSIAMRAEFLLEDARERLTADERDHIETMLRMTSHMGSLVDSLLEYAKLDYAAHQTRRVSLPGVLADVTDLLGAAAAEATITTDDAVVDADPDGLRQVLFNLVWNAIKYNERRPEIHVGTTRLSLIGDATGHVHIPETADTDPDVVFVRDNGIGIAPADQDAIFGLFRRLHRPGHYGGGSGAGLALCRRIVQRTGGSIWIDSEVGVGSTFYFTTTGALTT